MYWPGLQLRRCLWAVLHPPLLESLQKNPSRTSHTASDVDEHDFFTFRPRPVNHNSYRGPWDNLRVHNIWYKHEQHNFWYKHEQHNVLINSTFGGCMGSNVPSSHFVQVDAQCLCWLSPSWKVPLVQIVQVVILCSVQSSKIIFPIENNILNML